MDSITLQAKGFGYEIRKEKDLHMDGIYIIIEFEDIYQNALVEQYGWGEDRAENEVDVAIEKALHEAGFNATMNWEEREVFLIEEPNFSVQDVANVLQTIFNGSEIIEVKSNGLLSKLKKFFGL